MNTSIRFQITTILPELKRLKQAGKQIEFNERLISVLPEVKQFIAHSLNVAEKNTLLDKNNVTSEDILDEVYISAYEHLDELDDPELFNSWIIVKAEQALQVAMDEQELHHQHFTDLDQYTEKEWDGMEEKYSIDGGGDFVMMEEFDDPSYGDQDFTLDKVFTDDADKAIIDKVDKDLSDEATKKHFLMMLDKMPLSISTTLSLNVFHKRTPRQIAVLRHRTVEEIVNEITEAKRLILKSIQGRYL